MLEVILQTEEVLVGEVGIQTTMVLLEQHLVEVVVEQITFQEVLIVVVMAVEEKLEFLTHQIQLLVVTLVHQFLFRHFHIPILGQLLVIQIS